MKRKPKLSLMSRAEMARIERQIDAIENALEQVMVPQKPRPRKKRAR